MNRELKQHNNGAINHVKCGLSLVPVVLVIQMRTPPPTPTLTPSLTSCDGLHLNFSAALRCIKQGRRGSPIARDKKKAICLSRLTVEGVISVIFRNKNDVAVLLFEAFPVSVC